ncbi:hypothetical protein BDZ89DRAFT_898224, partial [Hymenopellis radicata]
PNLSALASSSASYMVSSSPITSGRQPPEFSTSMISPQKRRYEELLDAEPRTETEAKLQTALRESEERAERYKKRMRGMQATTVIQNTYVRRTHAQLQEQEEKKKRPKKKSRKFGDGLAKLVTGDTFYQTVVEHEQAAEEETAAKEARADVKTDYQEAIAIWTRNEEKRVARVNKKKADHREAVKEWERERNAAKSESRKARWTKPKLGPIEKQRPKPTMKSVKEKRDKQ